MKPTQRIEIGVLHGFRALMVLAVCHFHIWQQSWLPQSFEIFGHTVDLFFLASSGYMFVDGMLLLSGFLLYLPYAKQRYTAIELPSNKTFFEKRLVRILPSYLFSVIVIWLCFALPQQRYANTSDMAFDLATHFTFTFTFFQQTYLYTPLNGALWTLAIEMQFYLIFPFLALWIRKRPTLVLLSMTAIAWLYRGYVILFVEVKSMWINQLPAFLDVYALGILGAIAYCAIGNALANKSKKLIVCIQLGALILFVSTCSVVIDLLKIHVTQSQGSYDALHTSQLSLRFIFALTIVLCMLAATQMPLIAQKLLDNRLMRYLATISFNLYIWHQFISVEMLNAFMPESFRSMLGLQWAYTLLCYSMSILIAAAVTYGLEKPVTKCYQSLSNSKGLKRKEVIYERSKTEQTSPSTNSLLMRNERGQKNSNRKFRR